MSTHVIVNPNLSIKDSEIRTVYSQKQGNHLGANLLCKQRHNKLYAHKEPLTLCKDTHQFTKYFPKM